MKNAIIFDLDGTLWDSSKQVADSWNLVFEQFPETKVKLDKNILQGLMGKTLPMIAKELMPDISNLQRLYIMGECTKSEYEYLSKNGGLLFSGLEQTLETLKKDYFLAIVSNCMDGYIQTFLKFNKFETYFSDFECARTGKVKGENIKGVIRRNNIEKAVFIGDTQSDFEAAKLADIPFIHAAYGFGHPNEQTDSISDITNLPEAIKKYF